MPHATLVDATDIHTWASRLDAQSALPYLLRRLVQGTVEEITRLGFPAGEAVQLGGWDGVVLCEDGNAYVPGGHSVWELGTNVKVKAKADSDYEKRKNDPLGLDPKETTFVFVTPRRWGGKDSWEQARKEEGFWRDVRVYDADDLEAWLDMAPAVHTWLSRRLGKNLQGASDLDTAWSEWSQATEPPISAELLLAGRDEAVAIVGKWLRGDPTTLAVRADSREEALAFFAAAVESLPDSERVGMTSRIVVVTEKATWPRFVSSDDSLILVAAFDDRSSVAQAVKQGHHVLVVLGHGDPQGGQALQLPRLRAEAARVALERMGIGEREARHLALLARRSSTMLRRRLANLPEVQEPAWATPAEAPRLLPALLVGAWHESGGDRAVLATLACEPYSDFSRTMVRWENESDPPVRHVGDVWLIASKEDAWDLLARHLTSDDLNRFREVALEVLGAIDPRFDLPRDQRWTAGVLGNKPVHSPLLQLGIAETLAIMGARSDSTALPARISGQERAAQIVREILDQANEDWRHWASLSPVLPLLAEAAPEVFLDAVDKGLSGIEPVLVQLLAEEESGPLSGAPHTGLLWALETLAWSPDHLSHAALALARLARHDPGGERSNRPVNSLREIFVVWHPQTAANAERRLRVLDSLRRQEPDVTWGLLKRLLPEAQEVAFSTSSPRSRWREWIPDGEERPTWPEISQAVTEIADRLMEDVGVDAERWRQLVMTMDRLPVKGLRTALDRLLGLDPNELSSEGRLAIVDALRVVISRHRSFPDARWALAPDVVDRLEEAYERLESDEPITRYAWLFSNHPAVFELEGRDHEMRSTVLRDRRREAVEIVHASGGLDAILAMANSVEAPYQLGLTLGQINLLRTEDEDRLLSESLASSISSVSRLASAYVSSRGNAVGWSWVEQKLQTSNSECWPTKATANLLIALEFEPRTWTEAKRLGSEVETAYWGGVHPRGVNQPVDLDPAVRSLIDSGRPYSAIALLGWNRKETEAAVSPNLIAEALEQALRTDPQSDLTHSTMFTYHVGELLDLLEDSGVIPEERLAQLEWGYLPIFSYDRRTPNVLHRELARNPMFYADVVSIVYRADTEDEVEPTEQEITHARRGADLLESWRTVPGLSPEGSLDSQVLREWVTTALRATAERDRGDVGAHLVGQLLSSSPRDDDGAWPNRAVRDIIEDLANPKLERGVEIGVLNSRGVTSRSPTAGGAQERAIAEQYRLYASAVTDQWTRTGRMLRRLAEVYEQDAQREDTEAELREDIWG